MADITYRDEIVIYRVVTPAARKARQILKALKDRLRTDFKQEEILIVERDVETL